MTVRRRRSLDGLLPLTLFSSLGTNGFNSSVESRKTERERVGGRIGFNDEERLITGMAFFPFFSFLKPGESKRNKHERKKYDASHFCLCLLTQYSCSWFEKRQKEHVLPLILVSRE